MPKYGLVLHNTYKHALYSSGRFKIRSRRARTAQSRKCIQDGPHFHTTFREDTRAKRVAVLHMRKDHVVSRRFMNINELKNKNCSRSLKPEVPSHIFASYRRHSRDRMQRRNALAINLYSRNGVRRFALS